MSVDSLIQALSPTVHIRFDEASYGTGFANAGSEGGNLVVGSLSQYLYNMPGLFRDGSTNYGMHLPTRALNKGWLDADTTLKNSLDATGHTTGCFLGTYLIWQEPFDAASEAQLFCCNWTAGTSKVWTIKVTQSMEIECYMNGTSGTRTLTTPVNTVEAGVPFMLAVYQRADSTDIHIKVNDVDQTLTTTTETGDGVGSNVWINTLFGTDACTRININNEDNSASGDSSVPLVVCQPAYWENSVPTDSELTAIYTEAAFNGSAQNIFHRALDFVDGQSFHYCALSLSSSKLADNDNEATHTGGIHPATRSSAITPFRTSTSMGASTFPVDANILDGYNYNMLAPTSGSFEQLSSVVPNIDGDETTGTISVNILFDDQLTVGLSRPVWSLGGGVTASTISLEIEAVAGPLYHVHAKIQDSTTVTNYIMTFEEALVADEYAVFTLVQDGSTGLKLYKNGVVLTADSTSGTLATTSWISIMGASSNMDPYLGGGGFADGLTGNAVGMFMFWENPLTAPEVLQWYEGIQGNFNFFSTKSIRRNGRRLFSSNI